VTAADRRERTIEELRPYIERSKSFSGWSFDDVRADPIEQPPRWNYVALARERAATAKWAVDLGTGGGEVFSEVVEGVPARFVATEEWHVNAPVARDRLAPFGVPVIRAQSEQQRDDRVREMRGPLPFKDRVFGLVLSRHEGIMPAEIDRILAPGGIFLTQQVARGQWEELRSFFPRMTVWPDHFVGYRREFEELGYAVEGQAHRWRVAYASLGDLVYTLLVCSWEIPGFDPLTEIDTLMAMEDALRTERGIVLTLSRYLMVARKPG
jgi:SAM-dependent methyltransferase